MIVGDDKRSLFFFFFFFKLSNVSKRLSELHTSGAFSTQNVGSDFGANIQCKCGGKDLRCVQRAVLLTAGWIRTEILDLWSSYPRSIWHVRGLVYEKWGATWGKPKFWGHAPAAVAHSVCKFNACLSIFPRRIFQLIYAVTWSVKTTTGPLLYRHRSIPKTFCRFWRSLIFHTRSRRFFAGRGSR